MIHLNDDSVWYRHYRQCSKVTDKIIILQKLLNNFTRFLSKCDHLQHRFTLQILFYHVHVFRSILDKSLVFGIKIFCPKNYPCPQKTNVMARICKIFKSTLFYCQASTKTHNYSHYLCMFLNAGFQNLCKLNTGFDVLL